MGKVVVNRGTWKISVLPDTSSEQSKLQRNGVHIKLDLHSSQDSQASALGLRWVPGTAGTGRPLGTGGGHVRHKS